MDIVSSEKRSWIMSQVRNKDTRPELRVRRLVHSLGYRYRLHVASLPGRPDLVFPGRRAVVFVHGCFWHQHHCTNARLPTTNHEFWRQKLQRNVERDLQIIEQLVTDGWKVLVIWECETTTKNLDDLTTKLTQFLGPPRSQSKQLLRPNTQNG